MYIQEHLFKAEIKSIYLKVKREKGLTKNIGLTTEDAHEAIISLDTFEKVQRKFPQNLIPLKIAEKEIMLRMIQYLEENSIVDL